MQVFLTTILETQEKERERLSKDLHDSLGQQLSSVKFCLETLKSEQQTIPGSRVKEIITGSIEALENMLSELRNICFNLMPGTLQNHGLKAAIMELCNKNELSSRLKFAIVVEDDPPELDLCIKMAIFRVVQEFISNSIKHGLAKKISVKLKYTPNPGKIKLLLKDNGKGFNLKKMDLYHGMGLKNIKSRISLLNGDMHIDSSMKKGTILDITLPVKTQLL